MATRTTSSSSGKKTTAKASSTASKRSEVLQKAQRKRHILSVVLFAIGVLVMLFALIGDTDKKNMWDAIHNVICGLFGVSAFLVGPILIYAAIMISADKGKSTIAVKLFQMSFTVLLVSSAMQILFVGQIGKNAHNFFDAMGSLYTQGVHLSGGGIFGALLAYPLLAFGRVGASIIIILIIFVFIMLLSNVTLIDFLNFIGKPFKKAANSAKEQHKIHKEENEILRAERERLKMEQADAQLENEKESIKRFADIAAVTTGGQQVVAEEETESTANPLEEQAKDTSTFRNELHHYIAGSEKLPDVLAESEQKETDALPEMPFEMENENPVEKALSEYINEEKQETEQQKSIEEQLADTVSEPVSMGNMTVDEVVVNGEQRFDEIISSAEQYKLPPVELLDDIVETNATDNIEQELRDNSQRLIDTLKSFGVQTKIVGVSRGPSVTRYEIQPAAGVKISRITTLVNDIALNMAASSIRIEAPIPNKPAVGIEIPNSTVDTVPFRTMIESDNFLSNKSKLAAVLGKDISGEIIIADIAKMPHILIAGTTGSGKSVCVNSIIMSILFRSTPDEVRFLMIDPKAVEFMIYNGIPHLLIPVVTEAKKAAGALAWAVTEMLNRYKMFAEHNVRDLHGYNSMAKNSDEIKPLPQIVIFIDELADLIMASKNEVEDSIVRLSQMARAAGMHLVIATQRPTVDVVTGLIKANVPSRIALKVSSQIDSRTIIDAQGAEKLLGRGDMLFYPVGMPKPTRVQGCWVSDKEVDRVVTFIKNSFILDYDQNVMDEVEKQAELVKSNDKKQPVESGDIDSSDEKLEEAIDAVIEAGQASTSYLQRKLKLGYGRAARLIDIMEEMGVVGAFEGSKPRQVIMTREEWYERKINQNS